jgi:hypothetical protein
MEVPLEEQGNKVRAAATLDKDIADHSCAQLASTGAPGPCYITAGTFTRLGLCRLPYDKALVSRVLSISHDE